MSVSSFRPFFGEARVRVELDGKRLVRRHLPGRQPALPLRPPARARHGRAPVRFTLDLTRRRRQRGPGHHHRPRRGRGDAARWAPACGSTRPPTGACSSAAPRPATPPPARPTPATSWRRSPSAPSAARWSRPPSTGCCRWPGTPRSRRGRFESGIAQALQAILVSPRFLFRAEPQPGPDDRNLVFALDEHALAARLSYFLHGGAPDDRLGRLAARGELRANLREEVRRLLRDPRVRPLRVALRRPVAADPRRRHGEHLHRALPRAFSPACAG